MVLEVGLIKVDLCCDPCCWGKARIVVVGLSSFRIDWLDWKGITLLDWTMARDGVKLPNNQAPDLKVVPF